MNKRQPPKVRGLSWRWRDIKAGVKPLLSGLTRDFLAVAVLCASDAAAPVPPPPPPPPPPDPCADPRAAMSLSLTSMEEPELFGEKALPIVRDDPSWKSPMIQNFEAAVSRHLMMIDPKINPGNAEAWNHLLSPLNWIRGHENGEKAIEVHNFVESFMTYCSDLSLYGMDEYWASPGDVIQNGKCGDCGAKALFKYEGMRWLDVPKEDMRIMIVTTPQSKGDNRLLHAELAVREKGGGCFSVVIPGKENPQEAHLGTQPDWVRKYYALSEVGKWVFPDSIALWGGKPVQKARPACFIPPVRAPFDFRSP